MLSRGHLLAALFVGSSTFSATLVGFAATMRLCRSADRLFVALRVAGYSLFLAAAGSSLLAGLFAYFCPRTALATLVGAGIALI